MTVPLMGIGFHSFIDGAIYAITFKVGLFTGFLAAVGMVLHEFPQGIVTCLLLLKGGFAFPIRTAETARQARSGF